MSLSLPALVVLGSAFAVDPEVPNLRARQIAAQVRVSLLTGDWQWLQQEEGYERILGGLSQWVRHPTLDLDGLLLKMNAFASAARVVRVVQMSDLVDYLNPATYSNFQGNLRVQSWGKAPWHLRLNDYIAFWGSLHSFTHLGIGRVFPDGKEKFAIPVEIVWSWQESDHRLLFSRTPHINPEEPRFFIATLPELWEQS